MHSRFVEFGNAYFLWQRRACGMRAWQYLTTANSCFSNLLKIYRKLQDCVEIMQKGCYNEYINKSRFYFFWGGV